jgi:hypothetical protein
MIWGMLCVIFKNKRYQTLNKTYEKNNLYTNYIVCVISIVIFFIGFQNIPETVPIHQNIKESFQILEFQINEFGVHF